MVAQLSPVEFEQIVARINQVVVSAGLKSSHGIRQGVLYRVVRIYLPTICILGFLACMIGSVLISFSDAWDPFTSNFPFPPTVIGNFVFIIVLIISQCAGQAMMFRSMAPSGPAPGAVAAEVAAINASQLAGRGVTLELEHMLAPVSTAELMGNGGCRCGPPEVASLTWMLYLILPPIPGQEALCVASMSSIVASMRMTMPVFSYGSGRASMLAYQQQVMAMQQQQFAQMQMMQAQAMMAASAANRGGGVQQQQPPMNPYGGGPIMMPPGGAGAMPPQQQFLAAPPPYGAYPPPGMYQQPGGSVQGQGGQDHSFAPMKQSSGGQPQAYGQQAYTYGQPQQHQWPAPPAVGAYNAYSSTYQQQQQQQQQQQAPNHAGAPQPYGNNYNGNSGAGGKGSPYTYDDPSKGL